MNAFDYLKQNFETSYHANLHLKMKSLLDSELTISENLLSKKDPYISKVIELHQNLKEIYNEYFDINSTNLKNFANHKLVEEYKNKVRSIITIDDLKDQKYMSYIFSILSLEQDSLIELYTNKIIYDKNIQWEDIQSWLENNEIKTLSKSKESYSQIHEQLINQYGLSFISINNLFDISSVQDFTQKAFNEITSSLSIEKNLLGMNHIGLTYNPMIDYTAVCTSEYISALKFDNLTSAHIAIGHEWIHAIDGLMAKDYNQKDLYFISLLENEKTHPYPQIEKLLKNISKENMVDSKNIDSFLDYLNTYKRQFFKENIEKNLQAKNYIFSDELEQGIQKILEKSNILSLKEFQKEIDPYWNPLAPEGRKALIFTEFKMYHELQRLSILPNSEIVKQNFDTNLYITFAKKADPHLYQIAPEHGEEYVSDKLELLARSFESFLDSKNIVSYASRISKTNFFVPQGLDRVNQQNDWVEFTEDVKKLYNNLNNKNQLKLKIKSSRTKENNENLTIEKTNKIK
jgi:hypothetical protein